MERSQWQTDGQGAIVVRMALDQLADPILQNVPVLVTSVVVPVLLTVLANLLRRRLDLSTSTGGDLVLAAIRFT